MIIYSGFWAGYISGFLCAFVVIVIIANIANYRTIKAKEQFAKLLNALNEAATKETDKSKGAPNNESNS